MRALAAFLTLVALVFAQPVGALDIRSTATPGKASPAGNPLCGDPKNIEFNRADGTLTICGPDGQPNVTTLLKAPQGFDATSATMSALLGNAQPRVATNAALKLVSLPYSRIRRDGFAAAGDGGAVDYTWSGTNCTAADDGAQVQPTGRTGCWVADLPPIASVRIWGADPTGVVDSAARINAALAAVGPRTKLRIDGRFKVNGSLTANMPVTVEGNAGNVDQYATACPAGVSTLVAGGDIDLLKVRASGSVVSGICFEMASAPGIRTSGSAIVVGGGNANSGHQRIEHNAIIHPFDGITFGDGVGVVSMPYANDNHVNLPSRSGLSVGRTTAYGAINELRASNNTVVCQQGNPPSFTGSISGTTLTVSNLTGGFPITAGMAIIDPSGAVALGTMVTGGSGTTFTVSPSQTVSARTMAASQSYAATATGFAIFDTGLTISRDNEAYGCLRGTAVTPGANQLALYWGSGVIADSSLLNGLLLDTTAPSATIVKAILSGFWVGSGVATDTAVAVRNTGGGFVQKINFGAGMVNGSVNNANPLMDFSGNVTGLSVVGTTVAPDSNGTTQIGIRDTSSGTTLISGVNMSAYGSTFAKGVVMSGSYGSKTVVGNALQNATVPIDWASAPTSSLQITVANNGGVDDAQVTVASAASVTAPFNPTFFMSGTAAVSVMNGYWTNRVVTVIPTDNFTLATGGSGNGKFCNTVTVAPLVPITFRYLAPFACWRAN